MQNYLNQILDKEPLTLTPLIKEKLKEEIIKKSGYVYIAKNSSSSLFKIGMTKIHPQIRAKTLSNSAVLNDYEIIFSLHYFYCSRAEKNIHKSLEKYRVKKEFFSLSLDLATHTLAREHEKEFKIIKKIIDTELFFLDKENIYFL